MLWRGSFWAYLSYIALIVAAVRRRNLAWLGLGALTLANQIVVIAQTPTPAARYMFAPLMIGPLLTCVAFVAGRTDGPAHAVDDAAVPVDTAPAAVEPPTQPGQARLDERG